MPDSFDQTTGEIITRPPTPQMPPLMAAAIVAVMGDVRTLGKDDTNSFGKYKFVSIDKFLEYTGPLLAKHGLFVLMNEDAYEMKRFDGDGGKTTGWIFVTYSITLGHASGALYGPITRNAIVPASGAQAFGSAQSYTLKQFLRGLFSIPTGDKDDPDLNAPDESGKGLTRPVQTPAAAPAPAPAKAAPAAPAPTGATAEAMPDATKAASSDEMKQAARDDYNRIRAKIGNCINDAEVDAVLERETFTMQQITQISGGSQAQKMLLDYAAQVRARWTPPTDEEVPI